MLKSVHESIMESKFASAAGEEEKLAALRQQRPEVQSIFSVGIYMFFLTENNEIENFYFIFNSQSKPIDTRYDD
jgi:hypothetical protein